MFDTVSDHPAFEGYTKKPYPRAQPRHLASRTRRLPFASDRKLVPFRTSPSQTRDGIVEPSPPTSIITMKTIRIQNIPACATRQDILNFFDGLDPIEESLTLATFGITAKKLATLAFPTVQLAKDAARKNLTKLVPEADVCDPVDGELGEGC